MNEKYEKARSLGERLYILREENDLSQDELAEKLNVSRQTISNWENDKVKLDVVKASELCRLYGIGMDELFMDGERTASEKPTKEKRLKPVLMLVALVLSVISIIVAAVCMALPSSAEASSVIYVSETAGWGVALCCSATVAAVLAYLLLKDRKR